jgi:cytochrome c oxidase subunit 3
LFFGGLFGAYFALRASTAPWPPVGVELDTLLATAGTLILVMSSFTFQAGVRAAEGGRLAGLRMWSSMTLALGVAFLGIQWWDWYHLDFGVSSHAYGTMFFAMTGFHGLHVAGGLVLMLVIVGRMAQGAYRDGNVTGPQAVAYYWHFVDVVWLALFATLFVLR